MTNYSYKGYNLAITFDSGLNFYEGNSLDANIYLKDKTQEKVELRFRNYIDRKKNRGDK